MTKNGGSCSFAIDGKWGSGKSWVLDKLERRLQGIGNDDEVDLAKIKGNFFVFHYNAWENDYCDEPLISILTTVAKKLNELYTIENAAKNICKEVVGSALRFINETIEKLTGVNIARTVKKIRSRQDAEPAAFDENNMIGKIITEVRQQLKKLAGSQMSISADGDEKFPLIFIVDELDRCLPQYAIKVLERVHHVFYDIPRCVMILSIDKNQLNHTVQNIFGAEVNKEAYLAKFIDFTVKLDEGTLDEQLFWQEFDDYKKCFCPLYLNSSNDYDKLWTENLFRGIPMRERLQIVKKAKLIHSMLTDKIYQASVMYYEIYSVMKNQIEKINNKELMLFDGNKSCADNADMSIFADNVLKFVLGKYRELCRTYGKRYNQYNKFIAQNDYFIYMFYIYEMDGFELTVSHLSREVENAIDEERHFVKEFEALLKVIN